MKKTTKPKEVKTFTLKDVVRVSDLAAVTGGYVATGTRQKVLL